jgi:hypothetical protein
MLHCHALGKIKSTPNLLQIRSKLGVGEANGKIKIRPE